MRERGQEKPAPNAPLRCPSPAAWGPEGPPAARAPRRAQVARLAQRLLALLAAPGPLAPAARAALIWDIRRRLYAACRAAMALEAGCKRAVCARRAKEAVRAFLRQLPDIQALLCTDVQAVYEGDPAARSREEVLLCYPGLLAVAIYRPAHALQLLGVPYLPRMMTEYAHERTGIDIHPGASIGAYFCIDHGTGVVIGETAVLGEHVKLYQGVTLGARSFALDGEGHPVKGVQRHPRIGNGVVIYANATILGGDTVVGDGCVIGGNTWLTASLPAGTTLYRRAADAPCPPQDAAP